MNENAEKFDTAMATNNGGNPDIGFDETLTGNGKHIERSESSTPGSEHEIIELNKYKHGHHLILAPTGSGKSFGIAQFIHENPDKKMFVLVGSKDEMETIAQYLVDQGVLAEQFRLIESAAQIELSDKEGNAVHSTRDIPTNWRVIITHSQFITRMGFSNEFFEPLRVLTDTTDIDYVIVDEFDKFLLSLTITYDLTSRFYSKDGGIPSRQTYCGAKVNTHSCDGCEIM